MEKLIKIILSVFIMTLIISIMSYFLGFIIIIPLVLLLALAITLVAYSVLKKYLIGTFSNKEVNSFRQKAIQKFQEQKYKIKEKGDKLYVEKGSLTATGLYFEQNDNQVNVYRTNTATPLAWILFIVGAFLFLIMAIIIGAISESNSKSFAEGEILTLLKTIRCTNCGRQIPEDARICPYCSKKFL